MIFPSSSFKTNPLLMEQAPVRNFKRCHPFEVSKFK